jgi:FHA domain
MSVEVSFTMQTGEGTQEVGMTGSRLLIGRTEAADLVVADAGLSRVHASINREGERLWVLDEGSTNGTYVNGGLVPAAGKALADGDKIELGDCTTLWVRLSQPKASEIYAPAGLPPNIYKRRTRTSPLMMIAILALIIGLLGTLGWFTRGRLSRKTAPAPATDGGGAPPALVSPPPPSGVDIPRMANKLIAEILYKGLDSSAKDLYTFEQPFVAQINKHLGEYKTVSVDEARCRDIAEAFGTNQGMPVLLGFVMAMSRSKFKDSPVTQAASGNSGQEIGLLRLPSPIVEKYRMPGESDSALRESKRSAGIAAEYVKALVELFGIENFMYAVACFGMPLDEAATIRKQLLPLDSATRKNFWKAVNSGLVALSSEATERVARFFAAGIVGDNPGVFKLDSTPLSSLY